MATRPARGRLPAMKRHPSWSPIGHSCDCFRFVNGHWATDDPLRYINSTKPRSSGAHGLLNYIIAHADANQTSETRTR